MKMKTWMFLFICILCTGCLATSPEQTQSIVDYNAANVEMRRATLDTVFIMLKDSFNKDKKLLEMVLPDGSSTLVVYRYDNGGIEQICQMALAIVKDSDFVNFPEHPVVGFVRELKELGLGVVNSPAGALIAGGFATRWLAESVGDSAGHNTSISSGGHTAGNNVDVPTTTTTTTTETTETITGAAPTATE